ncbi:MAG: type II toxin-antitoxin system RelE/ParE family toxin [Prolixibacteraceae bacterium]|nr:type II toxin-antitoxin system RelE/ParE family toxin [Prolixibacteraceae bacterium]
MFKLKILPLAKADIRDATLWYETQQKGLGKKFISEVRRRINFIKQHPTASVIRYDNVRTAVLKIFPYMVHYTIDETNRLIIISAILHTSQNPKKWKKR